MFIQMRQLPFGRILAGMRPAPSEGILAVGVWAIFALLFARVLGG